MGTKICPLLSREATATGAGLMCPVSGHGFYIWMDPDDTPCSCPEKKNLTDLERRTLSDDVYSAMGYADRIPSIRRPRNIKEKEELKKKADAIRERLGVDVNI